MALWTGGLLLSIAVPLIALALAEPERYYGLVQEDGLLEWTTFWMLVGAAVAFAWRSAIERGWRRSAPSVLALASLLVAGEEISWGQRVFGYRPPELFLTANFQQEANLHNLAGVGVRQLALGFALFILGAALPIALRSRPIRDLADRVGLASPLPCAPLFLGALALQLLYPVAFAGEIVELLVGVALVTFAGQWSFARRGRAGGIGGTALTLFLLLALGAASASASRTRAGDPALVATAEHEVHALAVDLIMGAKARGSAPTGCGAHTRLQTLARSPGGVDLRWSQFVASAVDAASRERIEHFLDPWSSSYWVRDHCADAARSVFVYSLGPNRRRDSSEAALGGDDIGAYLVRREAPARR